MKASTDEFVQFWKARGIVVEEKLQEDDHESLEEEDAPIKLLGLCLLWACILKYFYLIIYSVRYMKHKSFFLLHISPYYAKDDII